MPAKKTSSKKADAKAPAATPLGQPSKTYTSSKIALDSLGKEFKRADLIFHGVDHSGATYEARIFLNNPGANAKTATTAQNGYAGTFHIFGHGGCFGDVGHCDIHPPRLYDPRPAHPLTPARKVVIATDAIRKAAAKGKTMTVTVVPIVLAGTELVADYDDVFKFDKLSVHSYA